MYYASHFDGTCCETVCVFFFFFFSSRRRHTRCSRDWSSDVCSSDLSSATTAKPSPCSSARAASIAALSARSEEHTSELQSRLHLVCRLLLEKKKRWPDKSRHALPRPTTDRGQRVRRVRCVRTTRAEQ